MMRVNHGVSERVRDKPPGFSRGYLTTALDYYEAWPTHPQERTGGEYWLRAVDDAGERAMKALMAVRAMEARHA